MRKARLEIYRQAKTKQKQIISQVCDDSNRKIVGSIRTIYNMLATKKGGDLSKLREEIIVENRKMLSAKEVAKVLEISVSYAYKIIDQLNEELKKSGYLTIPGKVDSLYLKKRYFPSEEKMQIDDGG